MNRIGDIFSEISLKKNSENPPSKNMASANICIWNYLTNCVLNLSSEVY